MKNKKTIQILLTFLVTLGVIGAFVIYKSKKTERCATLLKNQKENSACILTEKGAMIFELYNDAAPKSIDHLQKLANKDKFYDGLEFYRSSKGFVVQGGFQNRQVARDVNSLDDKTNLRMKLMQENIETEANFDKLDLTKEEKEALIKEKYITNDKLNTQKFEFGNLAFANSGPNTNSTEIFITTSEDPNNPGLKSLNGKFTNMGKIISGQNVLKYIESQADPNTERVLPPIKILEIRVK